jgi:hypothetical protein
MTPKFRVTQLKHHGLAVAHGPLGLLIVEDSDDDFDPIPAGKRSTALPRDA